MDKIIGIGNALVDISASVDDATLQNIGLLRGSMQLIDDAGYARLSSLMRSMPQTRTTGGSASNTMVALAHLGCRPAFIGKVGNDEAGNFYAQSINDFGIRPLLTVDAEHSTGVASTFVSPDGERTFGTHLGAAALLDVADVSREYLTGVMGGDNAYSYLYIEGYLVQNHALIEHVAQTAHALGLKVCLDLASFNIVASDRDFFEYLLKNYVDIVFANEEESRAFANAAPEEALAVLAGLCETAVVKLGARGSIACRGGERVQVPALDVPRVADATAAGDYFAGGFLYGRCRGCSLKGCVEVGSLLAGHVIQVVGTALSEPTWEKLRAEADRIVRENGGN